MDKIAEIREALEKATPGRWIYDETVGDVYSEKTDEIICCADVNDAHLIANAPEWLRFLLDEIDRLKRGGWISLKDQNPRNGQNVLICYEINGWRDTAESRYVNGGFIGFWGENVTHWQPLPEPPKEGETS